MLVSLHWEELSAKYYIYADTDTADEWLPFQKNLDAKAFLIKRKRF
jgi:hypothetical protein